GCQVGYRTWGAQVVSWEMGRYTANASVAEVNGAAVGRGTPNWFAHLPGAIARPSLLDTQYGTLEKNFRNPYTERWSFGFQRQLRGQALLDISYVGSESHKLTTRADLNPLQLDGSALHPDFGPRTIRTSEGN